MSKFDALDKSVIQYLQQDARMPSAEIARLLSVSQRTINNRIKRLLENGAIRPTAVVDPGAFGYTIAVDIFCELQAGYEPEVIAAISALPEVASMAVSTGDQDITLMAFFKSSDAMHTFITEKLHKIRGIQRTRTNLLPRIVKYSHQWIPAELFIENQAENFIERGD